MLFRSGILAAQTLMFASGIGQLMLTMGVSLSAGVQQALIPFLPGIALKCALLAILGTALTAARKSARQG